MDKGMGKNIKIKCCLNECKRNRQVAIISNQTIDITEDLVIFKLTQRMYIMKADVETAVRSRNVT